MCFLCSEVQHKASNPVSYLFSFHFSSWFCLTDVLSNTRRGLDTLNTARSQLVRSSSAVSDHMFFFLLSNVQCLSLWFARAPEVLPRAEKLMAASLFHEHFIKLSLARFSFHTVTGVKGKLESTSIPLIYQSVSLSLGTEVMKLLISQALFIGRHPSAADGRIIANQ